MKKMTFNTDVKVRWNSKPREMELLEDIIYTDSNGVIWKAPAGSVIDGASIPRFLWRIIGSPFVGHYRRPSVIHDVYCQKKTRPHWWVHWVFGEMLKVEGVGKIKAKLMGMAVKSFGPKWGD